MRLVILGGGISGLLAAYILRSFKPVVVERSPDGGSFQNGGLKYLRATADMRQLVTQLGLPLKIYSPKGSLYLDKLAPYPQGFLALHGLAQRSIQEIHWRKTRGTMEGFTLTCMNDPRGEADDDAIDVDMSELFKRMESEIKSAGGELWYGANISDIKPGKVSIADGRAVEYYDMISTLHINIIRQIAPWIGLPEARCHPATVAILRELPRKWREAGFQNFDYTYTPYLKTVHRVSRAIDTRTNMEVYHLEAAGNKSEVDFQNAIEDQELRPLLIGIKPIPGHLLPLPFHPNWPSHIRPLGRFSEWRGRITSEKVLATVLGWKEEWTNGLKGTLEDPDQATTAMARLDSAK